MTRSKILTTTAVIASLAAAHMGPMATAASAGPRGGDYYERGYDRGGKWWKAPRERHFNRDRRERRQARKARRMAKEHYYAPPPPRHAYKKKKKNKTVRNIAIGLGVLAIGAILASSASKHRH